MDPRTFIKDTINTVLGSEEDHDSKKTTTTTLFEGFLGEHKDGDVYTAENTRPIDLVMELFEMLREDKLYGQPGTDGSVASNVLESIKNDNDIWSCFQLNAAHGFNRGERIAYLYFSVMINIVINSQVGLVLKKNGSHTLAIFLPLFSSVVIVILKMAVRYLFELPCMNHSRAASQLRDVDAQNVDEVTAVNRATEEKIQSIPKTIGQFGLVAMTAGGGVSIAANFNLGGYIASFLINTVVFTIIGTAYRLGSGQYGNDREEFEKKWGALSYKGKYVHPICITDVVLALFENNGGRDNCLRFLDKETSSKFNKYFYLDGEDESMRVSPGMVKMLNDNCTCVTTRLNEEYPARFDGKDRIDPYNKDTKEKLYGAVVHSQHHLELELAGLQPVSLDRAEGSWMYIDPQNEVHGPYDSATMKAWHEANYFTVETMICRRNWSAYHRLGDVFPESNEAFVSDDVQEPQASMSTDHVPAATTEQQGNDTADTVISPIAQEEAGQREIWVYIDPQNEVHGPYDSATMKAWHEANYFTVETMICRRNWSAYHRLGDVFPESNEAFASDDVQEPSSAPPPQPQAPVMTAAEARAVNQAAVGANKKPKAKPKFPAYGGYKGNRRR